ncbi:cardiolipin synthase [Labrys wisconsinensis]|uniref:Cardiolipin synthase n=1 Tax=Labrys wisconsinensis TaxID=425677 RepID=A0ABU0J449_9HYPH|nr:cardiolipin synthase [Labrys wisconsinensis]MDQ0468390.1 cardiolipin synthase [Labrys wisconsinensis]
MLPHDASSWAIALYVSEWLIRLAMVVIVPFRRSPDAARGWLLLVLFAPWPALVLYWLIGRPTFPRWRRERVKRLPELLGATAAQIARLTRTEAAQLPARAARAATLVRNIGQMPVVEGNSVDLLPDYQGTIDRLVTDIDSARFHVHLLFYIFADDATGGRVMEALRRAAARGVACRVLIDALGSRPWIDKVRARLAADNVAVHAALPVSIFRRKSARADLRNHRKIAVIDGRVGYAGSQNIVDPSFRPGIVNKELMVRVRGPVVLELQSVFIADWFLETDEVLDGAHQELLPGPVLAGQVPAQVLPSGPDYPGAGIQNLIVAAIHTARERVVIATPYFVPSEPLLDALQTAVLRGVEIHLFVSRVTDQELVRLAQRSYYAQLMAAGVQIRLYRDGLLHAKNLSIDDDLAVIGSSNVDIRSFVLNSEVTLVFYDREVSARLRAEQDRYFAASDLLLPDEWDRRPFAVKIAENFGRLVSPLL